jgi:predicted DNA-binding antitoxin AbrB/MazE fold protein
MSQVQELIQKIEKVGGSVQLKDGDRLRIEAPRGSLTSEIKDALTLSKKEIIKELKNTQEACKPYIDWWAGGQTILETLRELRAPNEMIAKYGPGGAA